MDGVLRDNALENRVFMEIEPMGQESFYSYEMPFGRVYIISDAEAVTALLFAKPQGAKLKEGETPYTKLAASQLREYFEGARRSFDLPLKPHGTAFQKSVWAYLMTIPFGVTRTYQQVAMALDNPKAVRAVGQANNRNPISILIPCHRVIGKNGKLIGYGGGLEIKELLLEHEKKLMAAQS